LRLVTLTVLVGAVLRLLRPGFGAHCISAPVLDGVDRLQ